MKDQIHPKYYEDVRVECACGAIFKTHSTKQSLQVEVCSNCHPFYTGTEKIMDTAGRVEKFKRRAEKAYSNKATKPKLAVKE